MEPQSQPNPGRLDWPARLLFVGVLGYLLAVLLRYLVDSTFLTRSQNAMVFLTAASFGAIMWRKYRERGEVQRASAANKRVEEVLSHITPDEVAKLSVEDVAKSVTGTGISDDHLKRLVQQGVQKKLIDEDFEDDVRKLIVLYLQPTPRNAKRVLNRFRVNKVIAANRGLFDTKPTVDVTHLGKWLVLGERWPQLARALNAAPEKIALLETQAKTPEPASAAATPTAAAPVVAAAGTGGAPAPAAPVDLFMDSIKTLAPFYVGDEDLRTFIKSDPRLELVLSRLVYHGGATSGSPTGSRA